MTKPVVVVPAVYNHFIYNPVVYNLVGFNLSWLGLVCFGNVFIPFTLAWLCGHFYFVKNWQAEVVFIIFLTALGVTVDSILALTGVFNFETAMFIPFWLIVLWAAFAATINVSLHFLAHSILWQIIIGGVFPAASYLAGAALGSVEFTYSKTQTYLILSPIWACIFIVTFALSNKLHEKKIHENEASHV